MKIWQLGRDFLVVFGLLCGTSEARYYNETFSLTPFPRNNLLASFEFDVKSNGINLEYMDGEESSVSDKVDHYSFFPKSLGPIIEATNTRELKLKFTQGWWDTESWGGLAFDGFKSGGTGVEVWATIEAPDIDAARASWFRLANSLSGFFCASLNFIDDSITTFPRTSAESHKKAATSDEKNNLYLLRAAMPSEPICTENLTPFIKLLPTRGKAGISSLLEGHKLFDSLWHSISIDIDTVCVGEECRLEMKQSILAVIDITRSIRKRKEGGIPRPTPGEELRCDKNRTYTIWECFPLDDPTELSWDLETIFGRMIKGPAFIDDLESTTIKTRVDPSAWSIEAVESSPKGSNTIPFAAEPEAVYHFTDQSDLNLRFETTNSSLTASVSKSPIRVSRSLTGYSQDQGGLRVIFTNPSETDTINFHYFESLPWFMRLYLNTLEMKVLNSTAQQLTDAKEYDYIKERYYKPSIDRKRPSQLELSMVLPPNESIILTYQFDKSLLLYAEYPPDANHGFSIEPAIVTVITDNGDGVYELRTTSILLTLPTPDFSMPYNVIILTCTVMSLAFGSLFNLLTKKVITEEEFEKLTANGKAPRLIAKIKDRIANIKNLISKKPTLKQD